MLNILSCRSSQSFICCKLSNDILGNKPIVRSHTSQIQPSAERAGESRIAEAEVIACVKQNHSLCEASNEENTTMCPSRRLALSPGICCLSPTVDGLPKPIFRGNVELKPRGLSTWLGNSLFRIIPFPSLRYATSTSMAINSSVACVSLLAQSRPVSRTLNFLVRSHLALFSPVDGLLPKLYTEPLLAPIDFGSVCRKSTASTSKHNGNVGIHSPA